MRYKFYVGQKVKRVIPSQWPSEFGQVGRVYEVLMEEGDKDFSYSICVTKVSAVYFEPVGENIDIEELI